MEDDEQTIDYFFKRLDAMMRYRDIGKEPISVLVHPNLPYNFLEISPEFYDKVVQELKTKILLAEANIEPLDPITKFAIMMLENAY